MDLLQITARTTVEWMIYGLLEGTVLALFVWLLLRLLPRQNAGTRFTLWFSALLAMFFLPLLGGSARATNSAASANGTPSSLITLPGSWAIAIFAFWLLIAAVSLTRVVAGLWQVSRLRRNSKKIDLQLLQPEVGRLLHDFRRPVTLRLSDQVQVPTVVGFLNPAIVLPGWFLNQGEISVEELRHVLMHELSHLRRGDDWTNLAQKTIKAVLFFHPSAWWVEQQLSLEREMACDDEVLVQTSSPLEYARCLKHVAEKSFLRRQIALAQAVVSRMRQVSLRVAQILDVNRPSSTRIWKPALPMVLVIASVCGFSAWNAPALVSFRDAASHPVSSVAVADNARPVSSAVKAINVNYVVDVKAADRAQHRRLNQQSKPAQRRIQVAASPAPKMILAASAARPLPPAIETYANGDYIVQSAQFTVTMAGEQQTWHVQMWEVRIVLPPNDPPSKSTPRKNI